MNKLARRLTAAAKKVSRKVDAQIAFKGKSDNEVAAALLTSRDSLLKTTEWKELRKKVIATYGAKCMKCGYVPEKLNRVNIDHIKPRKFFPLLTLEFDNLQVLCCACNKAKGNRSQVDYRPISI